MCKKVDEILKRLDEHWAPYSGYRSFEEQTKLYAIGRSEGTIGEIVTRSQPGMSLHNYGLAVDFAWFHPGKNPWNDANWAVFGQAVKDVGGLIWGGEWKIKDKPHVQMEITRSVSELLTTYRSGGIKEVWNLISEKGEGIV